MRIIQPQPFPKNQPNRCNYSALLTSYNGGLIDKSQRLIVADKTKVTHSISAVFINQTLQQSHYEMLQLSFVQLNDVITSKSLSNQLLLQISHSRFINNRDHSLTAQILHHQLHLIFT
jgi:hypothetical protein